MRFSESTCSGVSKNSNLVKVRELLGQLVPQHDVARTLEIFLGKKKLFFLICCFLGLRRLYKKFGPKIGFSIQRKLLAERNTHC
jgi:hypothetical protein